MQMGRKSLSRTTEGMLLLLPFMVGITVFKIWPLIRVLFVSFAEGYNYLTAEYDAINLANYRKIFEDYLFQQAIRNTVIYAAVVVPSVIVISLMVAWCLLRAKRGLAFFQALIFLPFITSDIAIGMAWRIVFSNHGVLNSILDAVGAGTVGWLSDMRVSLWTLIIYGIWSGIPLTVLIFYTSMLNIDQNLLTAARVGGAGEMRIFLHIVLPMFRPVVTMAFAVNSISAWMTFSGLFPLFAGQPGPYYNLYTLTYYIYDKSRQGRYGFAYACAAACVQLVLVLLFLMLRYVLVPLLQRRKGGRV